MLTSQRALFDIPSDVAYLNAAGWSPLPRATQEAGRAAVARKGQPWKLAPDFPTSSTSAPASRGGRPDRSRRGDVALVSSVGYGVAIAGKLLTIHRGSRVLVLENDHTSPVLEWIRAHDAGLHRSRPSRNRRTAIGPRPCSRRSSGRARRRCRLPRSPRSTGRMAGFSTAQDTRRAATARRGVAARRDAQRRRASRPT